jgi:hypothetical protein
MILFDTIRRFKGLERPVIILVELSLTDAKMLDRLLYVGGSRARQHLVVIGPRQVLDRVRWAIAHRLPVPGTAQVGRIGSPTPCSLGLEAESEANTFSAGVWWSRPVEDRHADGRDLTAADRPLGVPADAADIGRTLTRSQTRP